MFFSVEKKCCVVKSEPVCHPPKPLRKYIELLRKEIPLGSYEYKLDDKLDKSVKKKFNNIVLQYLYF